MRPNKGHLQMINRPRLKLKRQNYKKKAGLLKPRLNAYNPVFSTGILAD
ncbi:hypothetical protein C7475_10369 [Chitinophaga sp. S165]|nr:hypothetical protein C7475_10369 [Chitinophaga sp. S165]